MNSIFLTHHARQSNIALAAATLLTGLLAPAAQAQNLLTDPSFELNPLIPIASVLTGGITSMTPFFWGQESSAITGPMAGVSPYAGAKMLAMSNSGDLATQAVQAINVSSYGFAINGPGATFSLSAFFNAARPGAIGGLAVQFFNSSTYASQIGFVSNNINVVANTWQPFAIGGAIPPTTTWMLAQVYYLNASLGSPTANFQDGFVDAAEMGITPVPEPASWAMLALGALVIGLRQRHRARLDV